MALRVVHGTRWSDLVASLVQWLRDDRPEVFETVTLVVSSPSVARILRQQVAAALPEAICAGVQFITIAQWVRDRAERHGLDSQLSAWRSARLQLAVAGALDRLVQDPAHPVLAAHLNADGSPARRMQLADRLARLLRRYVEWAPDMVETWLAEEMADAAVDATGVRLPTTLAWQPELVRLVADELGVDPAQSWVQLQEALRNDRQPRRTGFFVLPEMSTSQVRLVAAHGSTRPTPVWHVDGEDVDDWTLFLDATRERVGAASAPSPRVEVHDSHGPARQVEVLRDELCRRFEADPTLHPRDVLIVCPDPQEWAPHLRTAFLPTPEDTLAHPGRSLRLQVGSSAPDNLVLRLLHHLFALPDSRATASQLMELVLLPPVAHRWHLTNRRDDVSALVSAAEIRWGLDTPHRSMLGLGGVTQNTWVRGLDRLLAGFALPTDSSALPVTGVDTVATSDLELVGTLSELVSRLRRFVGASSSPAPVAEWVTRSREALEGLVGPSFEDQWMLLQAHAVLTDLAEHLGTAAAPLTRAEFARLFRSATSDLPPRSAVGNGSLHVVAPGDLQHVAFRLVCLLGVGEPSGADDADLVDLGTVQSRRALQQTRLVAQARAAEEVLIVQQHRDAHTDALLPEATAITSLLRDLGVTPLRVPEHPLHAHSEGNFSGESPRSFGRRALAAATAHRTVSPRAASTRDRRRRAALALQVDTGAMETSLVELHRFLVDPAKGFLQSAAGVRLYDPPPVRDELPLELRGLEAWGVRDRLLQSLRAGLTPHAAVTKEFQRESLPPKLIGRSLLTEPMDQVQRLWTAAEEDLAGDVTEHPIDLDLAGVRVRDSVTTRGGRVVHVAASKGVRQDLLPWLQILALTAMGVSACAVVHRLDRRNRFDVVVRREIPPPPSDKARALLGVATDALRQGRSRLVPVPLEPALVYAGQLTTPTEPDMRPWALTTREWDSPWRFVPPQWRLFYSDVAPRELLSDPPGRREPPSTQGSAFGAWAEALYVPLLKAGV